MAFKSILVHVDNTAGVEARIRLAARLACESHARLIGASVGGGTPVAQLRAHGATVLAVGISEAGSTVRHSAGERVFESAAAPFGLETAWKVADDFGAAGLAKVAASADLIVCGAAADASPDFSAGDLVMQSGRPVLVAPAGMDSLGRGHAVVAWKNARESRRALADALPLLMRFAKVTLAHVAEGRNDDGSLAEAEAFLEHHGVAAEQVMLGSGKESAADQLLRFARETSADLIVLGAFGHSRAREWIFGGVTADVLQGCPIPCLFSR
jgi:nucleotide-binding universal stress UspA family protein